MKTTSELWAVVNIKGEVLWTPGGSSTAAKLMVYASKESAKRGLQYITRTSTSEVFIVTKVFNNGNS